MSKWITVDRYRSLGGLLGVFLCGVWTDRYIQAHGLMSKRWVNSIGVVVVVLMIFIRLSKEPPERA